MASRGLPLMNLARMRGVPILQQLHMEEKLLRTSGDNWCIINDGTELPAIVMGLSGKPLQLIDIKSVIRDGIPVIRRFTGGGTVIVDSETIFVTIICNKSALPGVQPYPKSIMSWSGQLYEEVFRGCSGFHLCENDYAFGIRKFAGNAQSVTRNRWIHHTSFLWDYDVKKMEYLKQPIRAPKYRSARNHADFLCRMKEYLPTRSTFIDRTVAAVKQNFSLEPLEVEKILHFSEASYPSATKLLTLQELEGYLPKF